MHLSDIFRKNLVFLDCKMDTIESVLRRFSEAMAGETGLEREYILEALKKRESIMPTYIGHQTALPHSHIGGFEGLAAGFMRLEPPLHMDVSGRDEEVRFIICVLTGVNNEEPYLSFLSEIAGMMRKNPDFLNAESADDFIKMLGSTGHGNIRSLQAGDLKKQLPAMPVSGSVKEAIDMMKREQAVFMAVADEEKVVRGVVGIRTLIRAGLPDYILKMHDLSFISEFKPLEKFWDSEEELRVRDCMEDAEDYLIPEDTSHLEVLFLMGKYNRKSLITVDPEGKYSGIITETCILNRMLRP